MLEYINNRQEHALLKSNAEYAPSPGNIYDFKFQDQEMTELMELANSTTHNPNEKVIGVFED